MEIIADEMGKDLAGTLNEGFTFLIYKFVAKVFPDPQNEWFDDITTSRRETRKDITHRAMKKSLAWVSKVLGSDPAGWKWGNFHKLTMGHSMSIIPSPILRGPRNLLVRGPYPLPGAKETVNNAYYISRKKTGFFIVGGSSSRFIVDFSHPEWAYMSASTGMSANPMMPNFDNLTETWRKVEYVRMYMNEEDFSKNAKGTLLIKP